jgi:hypothetical protein
MFRRLIISSLCATLALFAQEQIDPAVVHRIKQEAFDNSHVMEDLFYLSDVIGPRLTGSPGFMNAANWAVERMKTYGLSDAHLESVGPAVRSWRLTRFSAAIVEPTYSPILAVVMPGSESTDGVLTGEPVYAPLSPDRNGDRFEAALNAYMEKYRGKLRGKIVLATPPRHLELPTGSETEKYSDADLAEMAKEPEPFDPDNVALPSGPGFLRAYLSIPRKQRIPLGRKNGELTAKRYRFYRDEGVAAVLFPDSTGQGGTIFGDSNGLLQTDEKMTSPFLILTPEHYNRIVRLVDHKIPVKVSFDVQTEVSPKRVEAFNVIGDLPGGKKKDEVVMIGGHLDSWTFGTGATDNGAGAVVMLEAMRILKTLQLPMDRTVRVGLWASEETGHIGSKGYVRAHLMDDKTNDLKPEQEKLSGYFTLDWGSGKIRSVYLSGNDAERPLLSGWSSQFQDLGMYPTASLRFLGGSDHESFDGVGVPTVLFLQDPLNYFTRTHHTNMDVLDYVVPGNLKEAAAIVASFAYQAATRPDMMPRKPLPSPEDRAFALK